MTDKEWMEGERWTPEQIKEIKELAEGCPNCQTQHLVYYLKAWRIEDNEGYTGTPVKFCPMCGFAVKDFKLL